VYQSIDDPQEDLDALERGDKRVAIWVVSAICIAIIFGLVYWINTGSSSTPPESDIIRAEQATYRKAISELEAPMRRARLQDFMTTYPESQYLQSVEVQLDVINAHEAKQWNKVTDILFAPKISQEEKLIALDNFEVEWGGALLGGRDDEIKQLRADIQQIKSTADTPSRKLKNLKSPIPQTVPDRTLAGGPRPIAPTPSVIRPVQPAPDSDKVVKLNIVQPKIRRSVTPRYPRKAMRRKVEAIVVLSLNVDEKGKVAMTELVSVRADRYQKDFIKAAERAAMRTRFHPKTINGQPRAASGIVKRYRFELGG